MNPSKVDCGWQRDSFLWREAHDIQAVKWSISQSLYQTSHSNTQFLHFLMICHFKYCNILKLKYHDLIYIQQILAHPACINMKISLHHMRAFPEALFKFITRINHKEDLKVNLSIEKSGNFDTFCRFPYECRAYW